MNEKEVRLWRCRLKPGDDVHLRTDESAGTRVLATVTDVTPLWVEAGGMRFLHLTGGRLGETSRDPVVRLQPASTVDGECKCSALERAAYRVYAQTADLSATDRRDKAMACLGEAQLLLQCECPSTARRGAPGGEAVVAWRVLALSARRACAEAADFLLSRPFCCPNFSETRACLRGAVEAMDIVLSPLEAEATPPGETKGPT